MEIRALSFEDLEFVVDLHKVLSETECTLTDAQRVMRGGRYPHLKLSERLFDLEEKLGGPRGLLVTRGKKASTFNKTGRGFVETARKILVEAQDAINEVLSDRPRVVIAMSNAVTANLLPKVLKKTDYLAQHPNVGFKIIEREADQIAREVHSEADFGLGPKGTIVPGTVPIHLCWWKRGLLYNATVESHRELAKLADISIGALQRKLAEFTVCIPPKSIIDKLELGGWLPKPTLGRRIKLPQASLRRSWVAQGLGVAISHHEERIESEIDDHVRFVDLSSVLQQTEMCFYFRETDGVRDFLSKDALDLIAAIQTTFGDNPPSNEAASVRHP